MKRERFKAMVSIAGLAILFGIPVEMYFHHRTSRAVPTHIEADNLRYLGVQTVNCEADGVTWPPRTDGGCYIADKPTVHDNTISGEQTLEAWAAKLPEGCTYDKSGWIECADGASQPAAQPSDDVERWRRVAAPSTNLGPEDCVITDPKTDTTYPIDCAQLVGSIAWRKQHGLYPTPAPAAQPVYGDCWFEGSAVACCKDGHAHRTADGKFECDNGPGPLQGQWMADAAIHDANCAEGNSEPSDLCCLNEVDEPTPCGIAHGTFSSAPPAVLKGPPTQVCVYDFVGSPYLRLNKAVSDPSCADFASPDDSSEELQQDDDYNNEIDEGSQI